MNKESNKDNKEVVTTKRDYQSIVKHNNLIKSRYTLDTSEQKLLYKLFEHVQKHNYSTKELNLNFNDFMKEFKGVLNKNITKADFKKLVESLQDKKPYIIIGDEFTRTQWYKIKGKINYDEIKLILDDDVFRYIQAQEKNFTMLRLESIYSFKKAYTFKIYELIKQWSNTKSVILFDVAELKKDLDIEENKGYKNYSNIEKKIILPAVEEINKNSELTIMYEPLKVGRKVTQVKFTVIENKPAPKLGEGKLKEVEVILNDGAGNSVPCLQSCITFDEEAPAEETINKNYYIPEMLKISASAKEKFIKICEDELINFADINYIKALEIAITEFKKKKGIEKVTDRSVNLFNKIFIDAVEDVFNKMPESELFTEVPATEEIEGVELPSWIQNLNNYDKKGNN